MKKIFQLLFAVAVIVSFAFMAPNRNLKPIIVVIDAGHGGEDFGAKLNSHLEKEITDQISQRIKALHKNENVILKFTRNGDQNVSLIQRTAFINQMHADLVLSLHVSINPNESASGAQLFISDQNKNAARSAELAQKLRSALESNANLKLRAIENAPFHILKNSDAAAISVELGFLSNKSDLKYLTDDAGQERIAKTIVGFLDNI